MFKKNLKRKVFSLIIVTMLFSSTVSFGSGFNTYRFSSPIFSNIQWRQISIFRCFDLKQPTLPVLPERPDEEEQEEPIEEPETPIDEKEDPIEVEEPEAPEEVEEPEDENDSDVPEEVEEPEEEEIL